MLSTVAIFALLLVPVSNYSIKQIARQENTDIGIEIQGSLTFPNGSFLVATRYLKTDEAKLAGDDILRLLNDLFHLTNHHNLAIMTLQKPKDGIFLTALIRLPSGKEHFAYREILSKETHGNEYYLSKGNMAAMVYSIGNAEGEERSRGGSDVQTQSHRQENIDGIQYLQGKPSSHLTDPDRIEQIRASKSVHDVSRIRQRPISETEIRSTVDARNTHSSSNFMNGLGTKSLRDQHKIEPNRQRSQYIEHGTRFHPGNHKQSFGSFDRSSQSYGPISNSKQATGGSYFVQKDTLGAYVYSGFGENIQCPTYSTKNREGERGSYYLLRTTPCLPDEKPIRAQLPDGTSIYFYGTPEFQRL